MPIIDFREIPPANLDDNQDAFELFARDFLHALGFKIKEGPSRGPDGGKDLIVVEPLSGIVRTARRRWLVSCKHYARSRKAVGDTQEIDVIGRVRKFKADGFMAFYSTVPSSELMRTFSSHEDEILIEVWDKERIESELVSDARLQGVFKRYFPRSYKAWKVEAKEPTQVWDSYTPLECMVCGKDLLPDRSGIFAIVFKDYDRILDIYWACQGKCDTQLELEANKRLGAITRWESIEDLAIPLVYVRWLIVHFNRLRDGRDEFTDKAFENFKHFALCMSQIVVRETTPEQWDRIRRLTTIPEFLGGLGR